MPKTKQLIKKAKKTLNALERFNKEHEDRESKERLIAECEASVDMEQTKQQ